MVRATKLDRREARKEGAGILKSGMKIGIAGHSRTIRIVCAMLQKIDPSIEAFPIIMESMDLTPAIAHIKDNEDHYDGMLFTGPIPYDLVNAAIFSHKPWVFVARGREQLAGAMLRASLIEGLDARRLSIDSFKEEEIRSYLEEIGMGGCDHDMRFFEGDIYARDFLDELAAFHEQSVRARNASLCVTAVSAVHEELLRRGVPCVILDPSIDGVRSALDRLMEKQRSRIREGSQLVALSIEQDLPNEYALVRENEYLMSLETMKITEEVYLFAQRIQAAVVERELGRFLLFTTRNLLEFETEGLERLSLLTARKDLRFGTLSVGIGYGETAREAKYNASLGLLRARKGGGNQAFKVENGVYSEPIRPASQPDKEYAAGLIDGAFQKAADTAGISLNSIMKLQWIMDRENTDSFTAKDLADLYGISLRSMHRLLEKLENTGYATVAGRNIRTAKGRPSRILRLDFSRHR